MAGSADFADAFLNPVVIDKYLPDILWGMVVTIQVAAAVIVTGIVAGLALAAARSFRIRPLNVLLAAHVAVFRALPPLGVLVLVSFGLPRVGIPPSGSPVLWMRPEERR